MVSQICFPFKIYIQLMFSFLYRVVCHLHNLNSKVIQHLKKTKDCPYLSLSLSSPRLSGSPYHAKLSSFSRIARKWGEAKVRRNAWLRTVAYYGRSGHSSIVPILSHTHTHRQTHSCTYTYRHAFAVSLSPICIDTRGVCLCVRQAMRCDAMRDTQMLNKPESNFVNCLKGFPI